MLQQCGLIDPVYHKHRTSDFNTYIRGSKVIDYVFVTEDLLSAIDSCGYHSFGEHFFSDHRAVYVNFNTKKLFGSLTNQLPHISMREIRSNQRHQVTTYIQAKDKHLHTQNFYARMDAFRDNPTKQKGSRGLGQSLGGG